MLISVAVLHFSLTRTSWGRHVYAVGNNDQAAKRTGIDVRRVLLSVYVLAGLLYGLAALQAFGAQPGDVTEHLPDGEPRHDHRRRHRRHQPLRRPRHGPGQLLGAP